MGRVPLFAFVSISWFWNFFSWVFRESISFFLWLISLFKDFHWLATRETLTKQRYINTSQTAYSIPNRFQQLLEGSSELRSRLLPATLTHSQSLPTNLTHSHPFSKKNNTLPLIFWQKRLAPTHFSRKITHSHHFPKKIIHSHPFLTKTTHSYPFFDNNDPLSPIFQGKRIIPTHFLTKATHSHPFFRQKRHTPIHFSTKTTHSHLVSTKTTPPHRFFNKFDPISIIFQQKRPRPTILILSSTVLPPKQLVFTSFPTMTDFHSPLLLMH